MLEIAFKSLPFREAVREAKIRSPQSYVFHSTAVGTLAYEICSAIYNMSDEGKESLSLLFNKYSISWEQLCFFGGFLHDWNKLSKQGNEEEARKKAEEIVKKISELTENKSIRPEVFIDRIALLAEGPLRSNEEYPLWIAIKLADMLMISDIRSVNDVVRHALSPYYSKAVELLKDIYKLELRYISSSPRLFTLIASRELVQKLFSSTAVPLISYTDGLVYLARVDSPPVRLSQVYDVIKATLYSVGIEDVKEEIEECLNKKEELFMKLNINPGEIDNVKQVNSIFPTKLCNPFEDKVGLLTKDDVSKLIDELAKEYSNKTPWAFILYFTVKAKRNKEINRRLGIPESFNKEFKDNFVKKANVNEVMKKLLPILKEIYIEGETGEKKGNYTLIAFTKKSFGGNVIDDLPDVSMTPEDYCIVCGMPVYEETVRFSEYGKALQVGTGGVTEIFIPRAKAMANIDTLRDNWKICPICYFEVRQLSKKLEAPYAVISFYPGIPVKLMDYLYDSGEMSDDIYNKVMQKDSTFYDVFTSSGGQIKEEKGNFLVSYLSSKVVVPLREISQEEVKLSTVLTKTELNRYIRFVPSLTIAYLVSPIVISSDISDIPEEERGSLVNSYFNYTWTKLRGEELVNYRALLTLLAYKVKYDALLRICGKGDIENCANSMAEESDLFAAVDPSLFVISFGLGIGTPLEEGREFYNSVLRHLRFLNFVMKEVSPMGETLYSSINTIASILADLIRDENPSKYDVTGFFRDGIDAFFRTSSLAMVKEDRIGIAVSEALSSLDNKIQIQDSKSRTLVYTALRDLFEKLYEIEEKSDRGLAIRIANSLSTWIYLQVLYFKSKSTLGEKK